MLYCFKSVNIKDNAKRRQMEKCAHILVIFGNRVQNDITFRFIGLFLQLDLILLVQMFSEYLCKKLP